MPRTALLLLPSLVTVAGLAAGLLGARALAHGGVSVAVPLVALGQVLDVADGWIARRLRAETRFGASLDWHCDVVVATALYLAMGLWPLVGLAALAQAWSQGSGRRVSGRSLATLLVVVGGAR